MRGGTGDRAIPNPRPRAGPCLASGPGPELDSKSRLRSCPDARVNP